MRGVVLEGQLRYHHRRNRICLEAIIYGELAAKKQRQYEHIKESAEKSGRYGKRAKEVAARTVLKEHKNKGHKKGQ
jgi:hypothetical protein